MKKLFLAVALVAASISANAQTWDFTGLYNVAPTVAGNQTYVADASLGYSELRAYVSKDYGTATTYSSLPDAEVRIKHSSDATKGIRIYPSTDEQAGLFGNGGDCKVTILNVSAGKYVHVTFMAKGSTTVNTAYLIQTAKVTSNLTSSTSVESVKPTTGFAPVVVADYAVAAAGSIELYITNSILKKIVINDSPVASTDDAISSALLKQVGDKLLNPTNLDVTITSIGAASFSSSNPEINISALPAGVYVASTKEGSLKFIKQ